MTNYAAVDLGATSGRVVRGTLDGGRVELEEAHRFDNRPVRLPDGLRWNLLHLFTETLEGLRRAGALDGIGVDTWGVDYALLDGEHRVLGLPFHYRDDRTDGMVERAFERVPAERLYAATGIQTMPINTVFQLLADEGSAALGAAAADRAGARPARAVAVRRARQRAHERLHHRAARRPQRRVGDARRSRELGLPERLFGPLAEPGTALGPLLAHHELGDTTVYAVASHDTASAFAAVPVDEHAAILSSGTWSLLGVELPEPVLTDAARDANLTNERGDRGHDAPAQERDGAVAARGVAARVGRHVLRGAAPARATEAEPDVPLFDPDDDEFLRPGDMPARIAAACERSGQAAPDGVGATVRSILVSLACKYRWTLERLEAVSGREIQPHPRDRRRLAQRRCCAA